MSNRTRAILILAALAGIAPLATGQDAKPADRGLNGVAFCIAAGEYQISKRTATKAVEQDTQGWRDVFNLIEATDAEREAELNKIRASFVEFEAKGIAEAAAIGALAACGGADMRTRYVAKYGSPALIEAAKKGGE